MNGRASVGAMLYFLREPARNPSSARISRDARKMGGPDDGEELHQVFSVASPALDIVVRV
jgi:hypothetical protein